MPWGALRVEVPESLGDDAIGRLALLGRGAHLTPAGDGRTAEVLRTNDLEGRIEIVQGGVEEPT